MMSSLLTDEYVDHMCSEQTKHHIVDLIPNWGTKLRVHSNSDGLSKDLFRIIRVSTTIATKIPNSR